MDTIESNRRTDEQLEAILCETGNWVIHGRLGQPLGRAPSLRTALDRAAEYALSGAVVVALTRLPNDNIIVFAGQMLRLRKLIAGYETPSIKVTDWADLLDHLEDVC